MLKKITVEEAVMLIVKKEHSNLYVKMRYLGNNNHHFTHFSDTSIELQQLNTQEFWLMTDDE